VNKYARVIAKSAKAWAVNLRVAFIFKDGVDVKIVGGELVQGSVSSLAYIGDCEITIGEVGEVKLFDDVKAGSVIDAGIVNVCHHMVVQVIVCCFRVVLKVLGE
jgi:uncharacterized membrane protein (DUF441 family)